DGEIAHCLRSAAPYSADYYNSAPSTGQLAPAARATKPGPGAGKCDIVWRFSPWPACCNDTREAPGGEGTMKMDYEQVAALLEACGLGNSAAEFHGVGCGQVSSGAGGLRLGLAARVLVVDEVLPPAMEELILRFAAEAAGELGSDDFAFQPLLPGDDVDLERRVRALGHWCEGFNLGFAAGH